jgi:hypothetical protein
MINKVDLQAYALYHHRAKDLFLAAKRRSSQEKETKTIEGFFVIRNTEGYWVPKGNNTNIVRFDSSELDYQVIIIEPYPVII